MTTSILQIVIAALPYVLQILGFLMHVQGADNMKAVRASANYDAVTASVYGAGQKYAGDLALIVGTGLHAVNSHRTMKAGVTPIHVTPNAADPASATLATVKQQIQEDAQTRIKAIQDETAAQLGVADQLMTRRKGGL